MSYNLALSREFRTMASIAESGWPRSDGDCCNPVLLCSRPVRTFNLPENLDDVLQSLLTSERIERRGNEYVITPTGQRELDRGKKRWRFVAP